MLKNIFRTQIALLLLAFTIPAFSQNYTAKKMVDHGVDIIRLTDASHGVEASVVPSIGNRLYEMNVHGKNILNFTPANVGELKKNPAGGGIPFLAPWANRLGEEDFWANGKKYTFNMTLGNVHKDVPIHGFVTNAPDWEVTEVKADGKSAHVTSRLQFWKHPDWMAQWPFAQEYEMTYQLSNGALEVRLTVTNLSTDPMPLGLGFHPCYRIPDVDRDQWMVGLAARKVAVNDSRLVATGELKPIDMPNPFPVPGHPLDTSFTDFERDSSGMAHFSIASGAKKVEILFGPQYPAAVIYTPATTQTVCIEPMAGITNAINLNHEGKYPDLQTVAPGAKWVASFWVRTSGI